MNNQNLLSIYRGQSNTGIGEGGSGSGLRGEQYIAASPPFETDKELLTAIRPWLTFDADVGDQQKTKDQLRGWSYFSYKSWDFVVYLRPAGFHDGRAAYFSHARVYKHKDCQVDWGLLLAQPQSFDKPWRDNDEIIQITPSTPQLVSSTAILQESKVTIQFLAHFYQAIVLDYPLIIAVPVADFIEESPLHEIISFIRAALPLHLKYKSRIRVYTSMPDLFLHQKVQLLVIPDNKIREALFVRGDALVLDRKGQLLAGEKRKLSKEYEVYAQTVLKFLERWKSEGTLAFSARYSALFKTSTLPTDHNVLKYTYFIAHAFKHPQQRCKNLFGTLTKWADHKISWSKLIKIEEWENFPRNLLVDYIVKIPNQLSDNEQKFQQYLIKVFEKQKWGIDANLDLTVSKTYEDIDRLFFLQNKHLFDEKAETLTDIIAKTSLKELLKCIPHLDTILKLEYQGDNLERWQHKEGELAKTLLQNKKPLEFLLKCTTEKELSTNWLIAYIKFPEACHLPLLAHIFKLDKQTEWIQPLENILKQLLRKPLEDKSKLKTLLLKNNHHINDEHFEIFIAYIELLARLSKPTDIQYFQESMLEKVLLLTAQKEQQRAITIARDKSYQSLTASHLLRKSNQKIWLKKSANLLFESADENKETFTLDLAFLLADLTAKNHNRLIHKIDELFQTKPKIDTKLFHKDWFYIWYFKTNLSDKEKQPIIEKWLKCWESSQIHDIPFELWEKIISDVDDETFFKQINWPRIYRLEERQLAIISAKAKTFNDLESIFKKSQDWYPSEQFPYSKKEIKLFILENSTFAKAQENLFNFFLDKTNKILTIEECLLLIKYSVFTENEEKQLKTNTAINQLFVTGDKTIKFIEQQNLWKSTNFLCKLRTLLIRQRWKSSMLIESQWRDIDSKLSVVKDTFYRLQAIDKEDAVSANNLSKKFNKCNYKYIATLINSRIKVKQSKCIQALLNRDSDNDCWVRHSNKIRPQLKDIIHLIETTPEVLNELKYQKDNVLYVIKKLQSKYQNFNRTFTKINPTESSPNSLLLFKIMLKIYDDDSLIKIAFIIFDGAKKHPEKTLKEEEWWLSFFHTIQKKEYSEKIKDEMIAAISSSLDIEPEYHQYKSSFYAAYKKHNTKTYH